MVLTVYEGPGIYCGYVGQCHKHFCEIECIGRSQHIDMERGPEPGDTICIENADWDASET